MIGEPQEPERVDWWAVVKFIALALVYLGSLAAMSYCVAMQAAI